MPLFAEVIVPLALPKTLSYSVPRELEEKLRAGMRVQVSVGNKKYPAIVRRIHTETPSFAVKNIDAVLDDEPIVDDTQIHLWEWMAEYYMCSLGEIMVAALPNGFRKGYKARTETFTRLHPDIHSDEKLHAVLEKLQRAKKQAALLEEYIHLSGGSIDYSNPPEFPKRLFIDTARSSDAVYAACVAKNIFENVAHEVSRLNYSAIASKAMPQLSEAQQSAIDTINELFLSKEVVLLHGVTASGKTEIYIHLIAEQLRQGKQVLYLVPEIALTTQLVHRLQSVFGNTVGVYHSKYNDEERVEIYNSLTASENVETPQVKVLLGVRSSVFLPFEHLGLVIVDEEHESSYKQYDPAPRYHARDTAIVLATQHNAKVLLGTATPAIETYYNAKAGKYGLVTLSERFHDVTLPDIEVVDSIRARKKKQWNGLFSHQLLHAMEETLAQNEQVILFQNRRGFSPFVQCDECGYIPHCRQCSVSLTYHKNVHALVCHYCGFTQSLPGACPECHSHALKTKGFGTEQLEEDLRILFPAARIGRLDLDSARGKHAYGRIIGAFERGETDILVGTQMVSKGLDFEHVSLVGVLNADNLLNFPDFRAHERSYQLLTQVSGRAGRKNRKGRVIIQTAQPENLVIDLVKKGDYTTFFAAQLTERKEFLFPPYTRLISLTLKHYKAETLQQAADTLRTLLLPVLGKRLTGPFQPLVHQIQNRHILNFWIRLERTHPSDKMKTLLVENFAKLHAIAGFSGVEISIDVDPG